MKTLLLVAGIMLALGVVFARSRVKRAFQVGAAIYAVVLVARLVIFGLGDSESLLDLVTVVAVFFLIWLVVWAGTQAALRHRARS